MTRAVSHAGCQRSWFLAIELSTASVPASGNGLSMNCSNGRCQWLDNNSITCRTEYCRGSCGPRFHARATRTGLSGYFFCEVFQIALLQGEHMLPRTRGIGIAHGQNIALDDCPDEIRN